MKIKFEEGELETPLHHSINSLIMEQACDTAEKLTELHCKVRGFKCWHETLEGTTFTVSAQDVFNNYYDEQMEQLYKLINNQIKLI